MSNILRIIFAGTSMFSAYHLDALLHYSYEVIGVFTQPDRPAGRGRKMTESAVKKMAKKYNIPIFQPISLCALESQKTVEKLGADIMVVVDYGLILPSSILNTPKFKCINVHSSLLPRWRGAAPIQRAIWAGDRKTGITVIQMDAGLDTGAILHQVSCDIKEDDTSASLYHTLMCLGANALLTTLSNIAEGAIVAKQQENMCTTYAEKLSKKEAKLNWSLPAVQLERCVRAFNPWPISYFFLEGHRIRVWSARVLLVEEKRVSSTPGTVLSVDKNGIHVVTGNGVLILTGLQPEGKKLMCAQDLLNSRRSWFLPGTVID